jgi:hypothetical protein
VVLGKAPDAGEGERVVVTHLNFQFNDVNRENN